MFLRLGWAPQRANAFSTFFLKTKHIVCLSYLSDLYIEEKLHIVLIIQFCLLENPSRYIISCRNILMSKKRASKWLQLAKFSRLYRNSTHVKVTLIREIKLLGQVVFCPSNLSSVMPSVCKQHGNFQFYECP